MATDATAYQPVDVKAIHLGCPLDTACTVNGHVAGWKDVGSRSLIEITDGSTSQSLWANPQENTEFDVGASVEVSGTLRALEINRKSEQDGFETKTFVDAAKITVTGPADPVSYPLARPSLTSEDLRRMPHLRIRLPYHAQLARFRSTVVSALTKFFDEHVDGPFYQVNLPIITWTDCEGTNEVFSIFNQNSKRAGSQASDTFFGGRRYLQVTAALHGEPLVEGLNRIWTLAPCFRAEANDDRHLAEFWMLEVAMNNIAELDILFDLMENMIRSVVGFVRQSRVGQEMMKYSKISNLEERWELLSKTPYPRISVKEAIVLLDQAQAEGKVTFARMLTEGSDVSAEHELYLCKHFGSPVFLTHFYTNCRLFTARQTSLPDPKVSSATTTTESFDLLLPGIGEICSGGLREERLDVLIDVMRRKGFFKGSAPPEESPTYPHLHNGESLGSLEWFADLRRWGTSPHGGYGIGFERLLMYLTGAESVKDTISFPRYPGICGC